MRFLLSAIFILCSVLCQGRDDFDNCFAVVVGKDASADGSVILGHNEDDNGDLLLNVSFTSARKTREPKQYGENACRYLWIDVPTMEVADAFLNEYGVGVVSDNCRSREDKPELTDGGVLYEIRVNVARYARTAREGVTIIGALVDAYGYRDSGRSYMIADKDQAWMVSIVNGKHWVAARIPDDKVVTIPNYYVIDRVDLSDTANFAGSADIVTYAVERGWYNPDTDGEFSFRKAYSDTGICSRFSNVARHTDSFKSFGITTDDPFNMPFGFRPGGKVSVGDVMNTLEMHRRNFGPGSISRGSTIVSTVFQLRGGMPDCIAGVCWLAMGHPGVEPYFPITLGMTRMPGNFARYVNFRQAEKEHMTKVESFRAKWPRMNWWKHFDRWNYIAEDPENREIEAWQTASAMQMEIMSAQDSIESIILDSSSAIRTATELNRHFERLYGKWLRTIE